MLLKNLSYKKVDQKIIDKIVNDYKEYIKKSNSQYIKYFISTKEFTINIYNNNTVLFQGKEIEKLANKYQLIIQSSKKEKIKIKEKYIGCDEVGVGDFFGPLVTCCAYVDDYFINNNQNLIKEIKDSKKIKDQKIIEIYKKLKNNILYSVFVLNNEKYNLLFKKYKNTHILKAQAHNNALLNFFNIYQNLKSTDIVMDQFVNKEKYFSYLKDQQKVIENIYFETKAESKYLAVGCASIIARYFFINEIKKLEQKYNISLPLGANNNVKKLVNEYKNKFKEDCKYFIKLHFNSQIKKFYY